jgi:cell division protein FtsB
MKTNSQFQQWLDIARSAGWINKYTIALLVFLVWMLFFDKHNMIVQWQLHSKASDLREQIETDNERLAISRHELEILRTQEERYAREMYRMHKPDEEVFVIGQD